MRSLTGALLLAAVLAGVAGGAGAATAPDFGGMDLTTPVLQGLRRLQDAWQQWSAAYHRDDEVNALAAVDEMRAIARHLGMRTLPDLATAAAAQAVDSARAGNLDRSRWTLEAAEALDPGRPEVKFARAAVARASGDVLGAFTGTVAGYLTLLRLPVERQILLADVALWLVYSLLLGGALFVVVQLAVKGPAAMHDLLRFVPPRLPAPVRVVVVVAFLLWPLLLPSGLLWLMLYWSILLWGYASLSERAVLGLLWILLGLLPLGLDVLHRRVDAAQSPGRRALESFVAGRLYGSFFSDLEVLHALVGERPAFDELLADLHRRLGQWEYARSLYAELADLDQAPGHAATSLVNLGVYHHRKGDYATAINYFRAAADADADADRAAALFNLSQSYSQSYRFEEANKALSDAKAADDALVTRWLERDGEEAGDAVVQVEGTALRLPETREAIAEALGATAAPASPLEDRRRFLPLFLALAVLLLAVAFDLLRRQLRRDSLEDYDPSDDLEFSLAARVAVPGVVSATEGHGLRGLVAVLVPAALLLVPFMGRVGLRLPLAHDAWAVVPWTLTVLGLAVYLGARYLVERGRE